MPRLFSVIGLARDTLHREAPELARDANHVVLFPGRVAGLLRSALPAADLVLIPAQPSPLDSQGSAHVLKLLAGGAGIFRPQLVARFVLNRCAARMRIAPFFADGLADHNSPLPCRIGQRVAFADSARTGHLIFDVDAARHAARARSPALAAEVDRVMR